MAKKQVTENRGKQILVGGAILLVVAVAVNSLLLFWRDIPGLFGEVVGTFAGILSTPFFMEASFVILGFIIVASLNSWRRHKEDEFVTIETKGEQEDHSAPR